MIKVGRINITDLSKEKFTPIIVLTKSSPYGSLGPYVLKSDQGIIIENLWQFSKIYEQVPRTVCYRSRYDNTVVWDYSSETHLKTENELVIIYPEYWLWRKKGFQTNDAIRYPVGFSHRHKCKFAVYPVDTDYDALEPDKIELLDYIDARKKIYIFEYIKAIKKEKQFFELKNRLKKGENLLILEVDGPHQESIDYYRKKYNVKSDFIVNNTVLCTQKNLQILLNDVKHPYGHGYCLAMALLDIELD
jgi:hypothetical protein